MAAPTRTPSAGTPARGAVLSYVGLRRSVGVIGIALPFVLFLGDLLIFGQGLRGSLSAYYYTGMRDVFVGALWAIGVFLFCYRYERTDDRLANVTGAAAVGVSLFPTTPEGMPSTAQQIVGTLHLVFAAVFFLCLAWFCLFLFTRADGSTEPTSRKMLRNTVYRVCGVLILVCLVLAVLSGLVLPAPVKEHAGVLFWLESVAILSFGVSWFVKGDTVFRDPVVPPAAAAA